MSFLIAYTVGALVWAFLGGAIVLLREWLSTRWLAVDREEVLYWVAATSLLWPASLCGLVAAVALASLLAACLVAGYTAMFVAKLPFWVVDTVRASRDQL